MKKNWTLLAASMLCIAVAACGESSLLSPAGSPNNNGHGFGSGNRTDSIASGTTVTSSTETTVDGGTTAERGGSTIGSGN